MEEDKSWTMRRPFSKQANPQSQQVKYISSNPRNLPFHRNHVHLFYFLYYPVSRLLDFRPGNHSPLPYPSSPFSKHHNPRTQFQHDSNRLRDPPMGTRCHLLHPGHNPFSWRQCYQLIPRDPLTLHLLPLLRGASFGPQNRPQRTWILGYIEMCRGDRRFHRHQYCLRGKTLAN